MNMRILIAEDNPVSRRLLEMTLLKWGYEVVTCSSGIEAWERLQSQPDIQMAVLDWMMPGLDGVEICRRVRARKNSFPVYLILLTTKSSKEDVVAGLEAGADDYVIKPFDRGELRARIQVGWRVLGLQEALARRVEQLEDALSRVQRLQGLLPICAYCKKVRNDQNYWQQVETYISEHSQARFSHSICPECYERVIKPQFDKVQSEDEGQPD